MYIILIAWLYVTVLMAATETTLVAGLLTLCFYGLAPAALFLFVFGTPARRRAQREAARQRLPEQVLDQVVSGDHGDNAKDDQDHLRQGGT